MDLDTLLRPPPDAVALELRARGELHWLVHLVEGAVVVGRSPDCDLVVPRSLRQVSGRHLRLRLVGGQLWARDLGSKNGTWLGGRRMVEEALLRPGVDLVLAGVVVLRRR